MENQLPTFGIRQVRDKSRAGAKNRVFRSRASASPFRPDLRGWTDRNKTVGRNFSRTGRQKELNDASFGYIPGHVSFLNAPTQDSFFQL